jgi:aspartate 1-decarboxylase
MEASGIIPFERVDILNLNNGERFSTYAIEGEAGVISVNGAAARLVVVGDRLIILSYAQMDYDVGPVWDLPKIVDGSQKLVI